MDQFHDQLAATPASDTLSWRHAARETAEAVAGLSMQAPAAERHTLRRAAISLARAGEVGHGQPRGGRSAGGGWMRTACEILSSASTKHGGLAAVAEVMVQLSKLSTAIAHARRAEADAAAARMAADAATELYGLGQQLHTRVQTGPDRPAQRGQSTPEQTRTGQPGEGSEVARLVAMSFPNRGRTVRRSGGKPPPASPPAPRRHDQGPKRGRGR